jgi:hypothetical protein
MRKIVLTFGLIAGAILSVLMLLTFVVFKDRVELDNFGALIGYTGMVIAFLMIFVGVKSYRDNLSGGRITFGRAFVLGLAITMIATACYVATWEVIYFKFMPDFGDKYAAHAIDNAKKSGASAEKIAAITKQMTEFNESYKNPIVNIAYTTLEPLPVGLLFTLIAAGVLSRKRRTETV